VRRVVTVGISVSRKLREYIMRPFVVRPYRYEMGEVPGIIGQP